MKNNVLVTQWNKYEIPIICYLNSTKVNSMILALFMMEALRGKGDSDTEKKSKL